MHPGLHETPLSKGVGRAVFANGGAEAARIISVIVCAKDNISFHVICVLRMFSFMLNIATQSLEIAENQMLLLGRKAAGEKVASFLVHLSEMQCSDDDGKPVLLLMRRSDIADYLGLSMSMREEGQIQGNAHVVSTFGNLREMQNAWCQLIEAGIASTDIGVIAGSALLLDEPFRQESQGNTDPELCHSSDRQTASCRFKYDISLVQLMVFP